jgi:hypothetical protein
MTVHSRNLLGLPGRGRGCRSTTGVGPAVHCVVPTTDPATVTVSPADITDEPRLAKLGQAAWCQNAVEACRVESSYYESKKPRHGNPDRTARDELEVELGRPITEDDYVGLHAIWGRNPF